MPDLIGVGRENAVYPETGTVLHDDHGLAHAPAERDCSAHGLRGRPRARDDLEQRHLGDRRKEMHPNHPLRHARGLGDARDRNRGRVRSEHAGDRQHLFRFTEHLLFDAQLFEHRLDRQLGSAEAGVPITAGQQRDEPSVLVLRDAATFQSIVEDRARGENSLRHSAQIRILHAHVDFCLGDGGARYSRAHEPRADDRQTMDPDRRRRIGNAGILLELIRREEDLHQLP